MLVIKKDDHDSFIKKNNKKITRKNNEYLNDREKEWDKMVAQTSNVEAENKLKKNKRRKKQDMEQYVIEKITGHELGRRSNRVVLLCIKWEGWTQTTMESVKVVRETAWEMVDKYLEKKKLSA